MKRNTIILMAAVALILFAIGIVAVAEFTGFMPGSMHGMHSWSHMTPNHTWMWRSHDMTTMHHGSRMQASDHQRHRSGAVEGARMAPSDRHETTCTTDAS